VAASVATTFSATTQLESESSTTMPLTAPNLQSNNDNHTSAAAIFYSQFHDFLFLGQASCSLDSGTCAMTIVNAGTNSSYYLKLDSCEVGVHTLSANNRSVFKVLQGTPGLDETLWMPGDYTDIVRPGIALIATCTIPPSKLNQKAGSYVDGHFTVELINGLGSMPAGTNSSAGFKGHWAASSCPPSVTATATVTITSTSTVTLASTTAAVDDTYPQLYSPENSSGMVWSRRLFNDSLLLKTSIDKILYSPGETMRLRGTLTNLTPQTLTVRLAQSIWLTNSEGHKVFWTYPEDGLLNLGMTMPASDPPPFPTAVVIGANQTITLDEMTRDWNMTGLHVSSDASTPRRVVYDNHTVPEGQYLVLFAVGVMNSEGNRVQYVSDKIPFVVDKATISTSTTETTVTEQASNPLTYAWAVAATAAAVILAVVLMLQRMRK
jgi:hypothetical protein